MKLEIEVDDKGEFVGSIPTELDAILTRIKSTAHGEGFGKGNAKAAEEAKQQIADAIKAEKLRLEAQMPLERQKFSEIEEMNKVLKTQLDGTLQESRKNMTAVSEAHALEITKRAEALAKRNAKIETLVAQNLRAMAAQAGAREESLGELEVILRHRIGFDDDMEPFVKAEDGSPATTTAGNKLPMDLFVKQYLDNHPHHRKPTAGRGGEARGGASLRGRDLPVTTAQAARDRVEQGDRSIDAINDLFNATRKQPAGVN